MNALVFPIGQSPGTISPHKAPYFLQLTALQVLTLLFPNLAMESGKFSPGPFFLAVPQEKHRGSSDKSFAMRDLQGGGKNNPFQNTEDFRKQKTQSSSYLVCNDHLLAPFYLFTISTHSF